MTTDDAARLLARLTALLTLANCYRLRGDHWKADECLREMQELCDEHA